MNIRAAKFVQSLRGLTVPERSVAQNITLHADYQKAEATMSMTTLAEESGLKNRETASRVTKRLESYGIIRVVGSRSGGGAPTKYAVTFTVNRDCGVTAKEPRNRDSGVTVEDKLTVTEPKSNRDSGAEKAASTVTQNAPNRDWGVTQRYLKEKNQEEKEKGAPAAKPAAVAAKSTALPHSPDSKPAQYDGGISFPSAERVQWLMNCTVDENVPNGSKVCYTKTARAELIAKLKGRPSITDEELIFAMREQIKKCTDDFSYNKFGTDLAANLYRWVDDHQRREVIAKDAAEAKNEITQIAEDLSVDLVNVLEARGMSQGTKAAEDWLRRAIDCRARFAKAQHLVCPKCSGKEIYIHETGAFFCDGDCKDQSFIVPVKPASETVGKN